MRLKYLFCFRIIIINTLLQSDWLLHALKLAKGFGLVTPDPFSSHELGGVWARDYLLGGCVCKLVGVTQEACDHSYLRTRSVVNKVHPIASYSYSDHGTAGNCLG